MLQCTHSHNAVSLLLDLLHSKRIAYHSEFGGVWGKGLIGVGGLTCFDVDSFQRGGGLVCSVDSCEGSLRVSSEDVKFLVHVSGV